MEQQITGFHQDDEGHWVAELECGHNQHVRHDPPWQRRPWVVTPEGRRSRLGVRLKVTAWPTSSIRPSVGCSTGCAMAKWLTCGSAKT